jgi:hypothetical protein
VVGKSVPTPVAVLRLILLQQAAVPAAEPLRP